MQRVMRAAGRHAGRRGVGRAGALRWNTHKAVDPYTGEVAWEEPAMNAQQALAALSEAHGVFDDWRHLPIATRTAVLRNAAETLRANAEEYAKVMATEMGKPVAQGKGEALKCAGICDYYAQTAEGFLAPETVDIGVTKSYVSKQPLGAVLLIMPWNFPFWQVFRQASAALAAGNVCLLKHASNVPRSARLIEEIFAGAAEKAGAPRNIFRNTPLPSREAEALISDPRVHAVSLTGSTPVGRKVGALCGKLLKPSVLELGGNDPHIILEDADIEKAARACADGRMLNAGQSCIGAKRFIVTAPVYDRFLDSFCAKMGEYSPGDPQDPATKLGPLVDRKSQLEVHEQATATAKGARVVLGGAIPDHKGAIYPATVVADVQPGTPGYEDEIFGPVASVVRAKDEKEAISIANSSPFGLGAAVYSEDLDRADRIARDELQAGLCFVNDFVKSDARMPFGGIKDSGYGRECSSYGINTFVNIKSVVVR
eukprot:TRINITY_DN50118_c0_g1_i1.p1 TRINITY_DN50118_c0_g1~~TRINITY_DN50118_c0_g1_i1.p1  ORF type:complete len:484 (+),score=153.05 TRINITY_DN50118_c0_g1_i1:71-1522(+)